MLQWHTITDYNPKMDYKYQKDNKGLNLPELDTEYLIYFTNDIRPDRPPFVGYFKQDRYGHIWMIESLNGGSLYEIKNGVKWADFNRPKDIIINNVQKYITDMRNAVCFNNRLINPNSIYYGIEGHKRLAREIGYALNDFSEKEQKKILHSSYSSIYVIGCNLKPLLDASEWIKILSSQIKEKDNINGKNNSNSHEA